MRDSGKEARSSNPTVASTRTGHIASNGERARISSKGDTSATLVSDATGKKQRNDQQAQLPQKRWPIKQARRLLMRVLRLSLCSDTRLQENAEAMPGVITAVTDAVKSQRAGTGRGPNVLQ